MFASQLIMIGRMNCKVIIGSHYMVDLIKKNKRNKKYLGRRELFVIVNKLGLTGCSGVTHSTWLMQRQADRPVKKI
jgi:hypothetical protein